MYVLKTNVQLLFSRETEQNKGHDRQARYIETLESFLLPLQKLNVEGSYDESERSIGLGEKGLMTEYTLTKSVSQRKYTSPVPPRDIGSFLHPIRLPTPHAHVRSLIAHSRCQTHRLNKEPQEVRSQTLRNQPRGTKGENKKESWEEQYKMFIDTSEALGSDNRVKSSLHLLFLNRWRQVLQATRTDSREHTHTRNSVRQQLQE